MTQKIITIEDVSLKSMAVEIKALTVSGKQMTLSVFRQLPRVSIWNNLFEQIGTPWGRVLYFWGDAKDCDGFQVVWQRDSQLFRSLHWQPKQYSVDCAAINKLESEIYELQAHSFKYYSIYKRDEQRLMDATRELERAKKDRDNQLNALKAAYSKLETLPQLFIAM